MKAILKIELDFESWFEKDRQPKSNEEWAEFFQKHLMTDSQIIGVDDGEYQDMTLIRSYKIECLTGNDD